MGRRSAEVLRAGPIQRRVRFYVTVTDSGDSGPATTSGTPTQQINRGGVLQLFLSWQADDPDNDRLVYTLQVRGEGEREWKTLKSDSPTTPILSTPTRSPMAATVSA